MLSKSTSFMLRVNQLVISIKKVGDDDRCFGNLADPRVLLNDVHSIMRNKACFMVFGELIRKPISVDEDSLARLAQFIRGIGVVRQIGSEVVSPRYTPKVKPFRSMFELRARFLLTLPLIF